MSTYCNACGEPIVSGSSRVWEHTGKGKYGHVPGWAISEKQRDQRFGK